MSSTLFVVSAVDDVCDKAWGTMRTWLGDQRAMNVIINQNKIDDLARIKSKQIEKKIYKLLKVFI